MQVEQGKFNPNLWTPNKKGKVAMSKDRATGLFEIPGTERKMVDGKMVTPLPVIIGGNEIRTCCYFPHGGISLGDDELFRQILGKDQIFPITEQPILANFGEFLQALG